MCVYSLKINTIKQKSTQTKKYAKSKQADKTPTVYWPAIPGFGHLWSIMDLPTDTHSIGENSFPFASRCQLQIASWLGLGPHVYFALSLLGPVWFEPVQMWCVPTDSEFIFSSAPLCVENTISVKSSMALALTVFSASSFV